MTNHCLLNIGLMTPDGVEISNTAALKALRGAGILWQDYRVHVSSTEPTLVVDCYATDYQVHLIATWLEQDCIAVWDLMHREGRLVGPRKELWGEFDPEQFLYMNGSRMSEARSAA